MSPTHRFTGLDCEAVQFRPIDGGQLGYFPRTSREIALSITPYDKRYPEGHFMRYGAVGDQVADDTTSVQLAILTGVPLAPIGRFRITDTLVDTGTGTKWSGFGPLSVLFNDTGGATKPTLSIDGSGQPGGSSEDIVLRSLAFDSSYSGLGHIVAHHTARLLLDRVLLARVNAQISPGVFTGAIELHDVYGAEIRASSLESIGGHGLLLGPTCNGVKLNTSRIHACVADGMHINGNPSVASTSLLGNLIEGNGGYGLRATGAASVEGLTIGAGNYFEQNHFGGTPGPDVLFETPTTGGGVNGGSIDGAFLDGGTVNTYPMRIESGINFRIGKNRYIRYVTANAPQIVPGINVRGLMVAMPDAGEIRYGHGVNTGTTQMGFVNTSGGGKDIRFGAGRAFASEGGWEIRNATDGVTPLFGTDDNYVGIRGKTPSSAADTGTPGQVVWDNGFVYICVAANTWKRAAIATW